MPGHTPFGQRVTGSPGLQAINPAALPGLLLYLRSDQGIVVADGSTIPIWGDQSPNARDANQPAVANQPTYRASGPFVSPNGKPSVVFNGLDVGSEMFGNWDIAGAPIPTDTTGQTAYFYARWYAPVNTPQTNILWQPFSGARPRYQQFFSVAFPDVADQDTDFGVHSAGAGTAPTGVTTITYINTPPKGVGGGPVQMWIGGATNGPNVNPWGWTAQPLDQYKLSGNAGGAGDIRMDLFGLAIFGGSHSDQTRQGVERFFRKTWGQ